MPVYSDPNQPKENSRTVISSDKMITRGGVSDKVIVDEFHETEIVIPHERVSGATAGRGSVFDVANIEIIPDGQQEESTTQQEEAQEVDTGTEVTPEVQPPKPESPQTLPAENNSVPKPKRGPKPKKGKK